MNDGCEGSTERTKIYQVAEALPTGWEPSYTICNLGRRRQHHFLKTPKSLPYLGSLMENDQHSAMRRAGVECSTVRETRESDGDSGLYRMSKLALDVEIFKFKVDVYAAFQAIVRKETYRM